MTSLLDSSWATPALATCAVALVAYFVANTVITYRRLRHIPGPRLASVSQLWLFKVTANGDLYLAVQDVLRQYGTLSLPAQGVGY